jgi:hypothetical protein
MEIAMTQSVAGVRQPAKLVVSLVLTGVVALSIHVCLLAAGVPYPNLHPPRWAGWVNHMGSVLALLTVLHMARQHRQSFNFPMALILSFIILFTIRETLRGMVMNGVVTTGWIFSFVPLPAAIVKTLVLAALCALAARWIRPYPALLLAGIGVAGLNWVVQTGITSLFAPVEAHFSYLGRPDAYQFPYPGAVMIPAYLTFAEPVIGATLVAALIWHNLPGGRGLRSLALAILVALIKGVAIATFLFAFFSETSVATGMASYSQFLFEFLALGALSGLAWSAFGVGFRQGS